MEKTILIVDNDIFSARILTKLLGGIYKVVFKNTADEAFIELENGLKPDAVMSSRILKGTNGILFLKKISIDYPSAFRVLITSEKDPKKVLEMVNQSSVNLFLTKPFNSLQLLQLLKLGIAATSNNTISSVVPNTISEDVLKVSVRTISNLIIHSENIYFRPHTKDMVEICRVASSILGFNEEQQKNLFYATLLHNHYLIGAPDLFRITQPDELTDSFKKAFFTHYVKSQKNLEQIKSIEKYMKYASMMFEHVDGSGNPNKLTGLNIPKEIQFLILLNTYLNFVYRVTESELETLKFEGRVVQTRSDTINKHQEATTYFYKNIKWFDHDLFYKFQDMIKKREIMGLKFNDKDLVLEINPKLNVNTFLKEDDKKRYLKDTYYNNKTKVIVKNDKGEIESNFVEEKISLKKLQPGDITTNEILDYDKKQILPPFYEHTEASIGKLIERLANRSISEVVFKKAD